MVALPAMRAREAVAEALDAAADSSLATLPARPNAVVVMPCYNEARRLDPNVHLLNKPYTQQDLARKVGELLGRRSAGGKS